MENPGSNGSPEKGNRITGNRAAQIRAALLFFIWHPGKTGIF